MGKPSKDLGCPICGKRGHLGHCSPGTYKAIDAANARAGNGTEKFSDEATRPEAERLLAGLRMMMEDDYEW